MDIYKLSRGFSAGFESLTDGGNPMKRNNITNRMKESVKKAIRAVSGRLQWYRSIFYIHEPSGKRKCHVICTVNSLKMNRMEENNYLIYADGTRDSAGNIILFSAMFYPQAPAGQQLKPISDPEEQERVNWIIKDMRDSIGDQLNALPF